MNFKQKSKWGLLAEQQGLNSGFTEFLVLAALLVEAAWMQRSPIAGELLHLFQLNAAGRYKVTWVTP